MRSWLLILFMLFAVLPAQADDDDHERARAAVARGDILPLSRILDIAKRDTPGRVIDIELDEEDGRYIYEIEIIDGRGRIVEMKLDAASGRIVERDIDD